jgi:uncharacterized membrane protein
MRAFHEIQLNHEYVFHYKNADDEIDGRLGIIGSRMATVVVAVQGKKMAYGVARCNEKDQFCRKIGRTIAEGRAKMALAHTITPQKLYQHCAGMLPDVVDTEDEKQIFDMCRGVANTVIQGLNYQVARL